MLQNVRNTKEIRQFLINNISSNTLVTDTMAMFGITRAAVYRNLQHLIKENIIQHDNAAKGRKYWLVKHEYKFSYNITNELSESVVWSQDIAPLMPEKDNVNRIWEHGFTEMFNNAIEHSQGTKINVIVWVDALNTTIIIYDNGIGIFRNIKDKFGLLNEREALLELAKGKLTTDSQNHSGEGIFFTSRIFDWFIISSYNVAFTHNDNAQAYKDIFVEQEPGALDGTGVMMRMSNDSERKLLDVFDKFSVDDNYSFDKTLIPIELARYGGDNLVSRSQARRVMSRIELFKSVILDFEDVPYIGQAFADEIFRVFANEHPDIEILVLNANEDVQKMISRAKNVKL